MIAPARRAARLARAHRLVRDGCCQPIRHTPRDTAPFLALGFGGFVAVLVLAVLVNASINALASLFAPPPAEVPWADRVDDHDDSFPFVESGPVPDEEPAPPAPADDSPHFYRGEQPREFPDECQEDDDCPEAAPHCAPHRHCRECYSDTQCPGAQNYCVDERCQMREPYTFGDTTSSLDPHRLYVHASVAWSSAGTPRWVPFESP